MDVNTIDYLDHLIKHFNRVSELWEKSNEHRDDGVLLCAKIIDNFNALKRVPQKSGIKTMPPVPAYPHSEVVNKHHEAGKLTYLWYQCGRVLTNAKLERINANLCLEGPTVVKLVVDEEGKWSTDDINLEVQLSEASRSFAGINFNNGGYPIEGKFVFMKDGTFFLFDQGIAHSDVMRLIGVHDRVACLSAGFCYIYETDISFHGKSISLDRDPRHDGSDLKRVAEHLHIPLKVKA